MIIKRGHLTDDRGRKWNGFRITFRTSNDDVWQIGVITKRRGAPTMIEVANHKSVPGWIVTEFMINDPEVNPKEM